MAAPAMQLDAPADIKGEPEEEEAAAALAAVRSPPSRSANPSAGASDSRDEEISDGSDDMEEQPQGRLSGSQSHTTLPTERGQQQGAAGPLQPGGYAAPQQLAQLQQLAMLAQPGASTMLTSPQSQGQAQRGRRSARQQEQNKQAQQRYRAKRKAQFEEMQRKVQVLSVENAELQRVREENERLRAEATRLRALLSQTCDGSGGAPSVAAAAAGPPGSSPAPATATATLQQLQAASSGSLPDLLAATVGRAPGLPLGAVVGGSSGAFRPTAAARPLSAATLAELPSSASGTAAALGGGAPSGKGGLAAAPPKQVQGALNLYYRDLQAFAASVQLERVPADGTGLAAEASSRLTSLVRTGIELIKLILHASGPDAAALLTANMPVAGGPDAASPADSLQQWRMVAARVGLSPEQRAALADWRARFLQRIDDCYGRRLLLKAQLAQLPGASGSQWVEALLLQSAESAGYSACALACAQLDESVSQLGQNAAEERAAACEFMGELLEGLLTKVQAARFLLAGHPFCWNGLSFAHAVASMQPAAQQAQQPALTAALAGLPGLSALALPQSQPVPQPAALPAPAAQPQLPLPLSLQGQAPAALQKQLAELLAACATGT